MNQTERFSFCRPKWLLMTLTAASVWHLNLFSLHFYLLASFKHLFEGYSEKKRKSEPAFKSLPHFDRNVFDCFLKSFHFTGHKLTILIDLKMHYC